MLVRSIVIPLALSLGVGMLALWLSLRGAAPRQMKPETALLAVLLGLGASLSPVLVLLPLWAALGVAAVWPKRAILFIVLGYGVLGAVAMLGLTAWSFVWQGAAASAAVWVGGALVGTALGCYQLYHWRWWPPFMQTLWGCTGFSLIFASGSLGYSTGLAVVNFLLIPLPLWAWWLVKRRQKF